MIKKISLLIGILLCVYIGLLVSVVKTDINPIQKQTNTIASPSSILKAKEIQIQIRAPILETAFQELGSQPTIHEMLPEIPLMTITNGWAEINRYLFGEVSSVRSVISGSLVGSKTNTLLVPRHSSFRSIVELIRTANPVSISLIEMKEGGAEIKLKLEFLSSEGIVLMSGGSTIGFGSDMFKAFPAGILPMDPSLQIPPFLKVPFAGKISECKWVGIESNIWSLQWTYHENTQTSYIKFPQSCIGHGQLLVDTIDEKGKNKPLSINLAGNFPDQ